MTLLGTLLNVSLLFAQAQAPPDDLFKTIAALDVEVFQAYNDCDLKKSRSFFTDDLEFYHDQTGLTVGAQTVMEQVKENICGKVRRELVSGTLEVYPLRGYGAVEMGVHRFYPPEKGSAPMGEAKFIHLWQNKDGAWKITRVISYDHGPVKK